MKYLFALLGAGTFVGANLPNADNGECVLVARNATRTEPTMIDPDGEVTALRVVFNCGYQYPGTTGNIVNKDDLFTFEPNLDGLDDEQREALAEAVTDLVEP